MINTRVVTFWWIYIHFPYLRKSINLAAVDWRRAFSMNSTLRMMSSKSRTFYKSLQCRSRSPAHVMVRPYSTLSSPLNRPTLSQIREEDKTTVIFYLKKFQKFQKFSKILQLLYQKSNWRVFDYYSSVFKEEKKLRRSCSQ